MKTKLIAIVCFTLSFGFYSCDDREEIIYEGSNSDQTIIGFTETSDNLEIARDDEGTLLVQVTSSATRPNDRTYQINVIEEETTADPSTYDVPTQVTILAGERIAEFEIQGFDNGVETTPETLVIELEGINTEDSVSAQRMDISVYEVCPIPTDYLIGEYTIADGQATIGPNNDSAGFQSQTVTIEPGPTSTSRVFTAVALPGLTNTQAEIRLSLVCGSINFNTTIDTGIGCVDSESTILYESATVAGFPNSSYSVTSDDQITVTYAEDSQNSCGGPFQSTFILTKINQ